MYLNNLNKTIFDKIKDIKIFNGFRSFFFLLFCLAVCERRTEGVRKRRRYNAGVSIANTASCIIERCFQEIDLKTFLINDFPLLAISYFANFPPLNLWFSIYEMLADFASLQLASCASVRILPLSAFFSVQHKDPSKTLNKLFLPPRFFQIFHFTVFIIFILHPPPQLFPSFAFPSISFLKMENPERYMLPGGLLFFFYFIV